MTVAGMLDKFKQQETLFPNAIELDDSANCVRAPGLYQLSTWLQIINNAYGHQTYYLRATREGAQIKIEKTSGANDHAKGYGGNSDRDKIAGGVSLTNLKSFVFGNDLISMPFLDWGGIWADEPDVEKSLLKEALSLAQRLKARSIQIRQTTPLLSLPEFDGIKPNPIDAGWLSAMGYAVHKRVDKARMLLDLPDSSETLMGRFKSKLRTQIRKPSKEGLVSKIGGLELLDDFYKVFSINMRDLGSPVHSKRLLRCVLEGFQESSNICMVYYKERPLACGIIIGFRDVLYNPWASSLRKYGRLSPNMLLYWTMLQYACDSGYKYFDFGRSSIEENTYKFKEQWGARPQVLHWYYINQNNMPREMNSEKSKFSLAIRIWQKLPVSLTQILGPPIRKHIGL